MKIIVQTFSSNMHAGKYFDVPTRFFDTINQFYITFSFSNILTPKQDLILIKYMMNHTGVHIPKQAISDK